MNMEIKDILITAIVILLPVSGLVVYRLRYKIIALLKALLVLGCLGGAVTGAIWYGPEPEVIERIVRVPVPVERNKDEAYREAIETIPQKYGIPKIVMEVLIEKESAGNMTAVRFEPHVMARAKKISGNDGEQRMLSSSHGLAQILGTTAHEMGVHWSELYDPITNIDTASAYLAKRKQECSKSQKTEYDRIKCAARGYNGSGQMAERYSQDFMERLARRIINEGGL
jgi:soluble lytic murein transglycosylase-like protein